MCSVNYKNSRTVKDIYASNVLLVETMEHKVQYMLLKHLSNKKQYLVICGPLWEPVMEYMKANPSKRDEKTDPINTFFPWLHDIARHIASNIGMYFKKDSVHVVGHSLGAIGALLAAQQMQERGIKLSGVTCFGLPRVCYSDWDRDFTEKIKNLHAMRVMDASDEYASDLFDSCYHHGPDLVLVSDLNYVLLEEREKDRTLPAPVYHSGNRLWQEGRLMELVAKHHIENYSDKISKIKNNPKQITPAEAEKLL